MHVNFSILNSRQEKHDAPAVTKVNVEVVVDTTFATTLRAFTFCYQNCVHSLFLFLYKKYSFTSPLEPIKYLQSSA